MASWRGIFEYKVGCIPLLLIHGMVVLAAYSFVWKPQPVTQEPKNELAWNARSPDATWPWKRATMRKPYRGVVHWKKTSDDGTDLELVRFDFAANPRLRFEMYDQDQDAPQPWTNKVRYYDRGVAQAAAHLHSIGRGKIIAATNGMFFHATGYGEKDTASHVSPVVVDGKAHYANGENIRWTFGVKYIDGKPRFEAYRMPEKAILDSRFDFAAGGAQALIWNGAVAASPAEHVGYDSAFENMRTSRVAWGWTKDSKQLYLLFVEEPDSEIGSKVAAKHHKHLGGGWMFADERGFFSKLGVWCAFNSDAGDVAQMVLLRKDGQYDFVPPKTSQQHERRILPVDKSGAVDASSAPGNGSLMYWYVTEKR